MQRFGVIVLLVAALSSLAPAVEPEDPVRAYQEWLSLCARLLLSAVVPTSLDNYAGPPESLQDEINQRHFERTWVLKTAGEQLPPLMRLSSLAYFAPHYRYATSDLKWEFDLLIPDEETREFSILPLPEDKLILVNALDYENDLSLDIVYSVVLAIVTERLRHPLDMAILKNALTEDTERSLMGATLEGSPPPEVPSGVEAWLELLEEEPHPFKTYDQLLASIVGELAGRLASVQAYRRLRERFPGIRHTGLELIHGELAGGMPISELAGMAVDVEEEGIEKWAYQALAREFLASGLLEKWGLKEVLLGEKANAQLKIAAVPVVTSAVLMGGDALEVMPRTVSSPAGKAFVSHSRSNFVWTQPGEQLPHYLPVAPKAWVHLLTFEDRGITFQATINGQTSIGRLTLDTVEQPWAGNFIPTTAEQHAAARGNSVYLLTPQRVPYQAGVTPITLLQINSLSGKTENAAALGSWSARATRLYPAKKHDSLLWTLGAKDAHTGIVVTDGKGIMKNEIPFPEPGDTRISHEDEKGNFWVEHLARRGASDKITWGQYVSYFKVISPEGNVLAARKFANTTLFAADAVRVYFLRHVPNSYGMLVGFDVQMHDQVWTRSLENVFDTPYQSPQSVGVAENGWLYLSTPNQVFAIDTRSTAAEVVFQRPNEHAYDPTSPLITLSGSSTGLLNFAYRFIDLEPADPRAPRRVRLASIPLK